MLEVKEMFQMLIGQAFLPIRVSLGDCWKYKYKYLRLNLTFVHEDFLMHKNGLTVLHLPLKDKDTVTNDKTSTDCEGAHFSTLTP